MKHPARTFLITVFLSAFSAAEPVTTTRVSLAPSEEQPAWRNYLDRSQAAAAADRAALEAELAANKLQAALPAPSGGDFKIPADTDGAWFGSDEAKNLADIVISYQTPSGGWSKHTGYGKGPRKSGMLWSSQYKPGDKPHYLGTFDNHSTTQQIRLLAGVWRAAGREDCKAAAIKGFDYVLSAQFPNGGWPQVYPLEGSYHDHITFNDDAMTNVLLLLQDASSGAPEFSFIDERLKERIQNSLTRGIGCVIQTQIVQNGAKTGWCAQYDAITLQPERARAMEPVALSGLESANVLKFLMGLREPDRATIACIDAGLRWLERVCIVGMSRTKRDGRTAFETNPASTEVYWARFYSLTDSKPLFPGRDGVVYNTFEEMSAHNKLGYDYYTSRPGSVVNNGQKKWRRFLAKRNVD